MWLHLNETILQSNKSLSKEKQVIFLFSRSFSAYLIVAQLLLFMKMFVLPNLQTKKMHVLLLVAG